MHGKGETRGVVGIVAVLVLSAALVFAVRGCGYGEVSPKAYEFATALHSICNRHDTERLDKFTKMLNEARAAGEISEQEADWLTDITDQARAGDWEDATADARRMLEDQVKGGP